MQNDRYPNISIRSKNELAKRISSRRLGSENALGLINRVLSQKDGLWHDNEKMSEPEKNKFVRDASQTELGKLLKLVDKRVLAPHDSSIPPYILGGVSKRSNIMAITKLLPIKKRTLLKMDLKRFFEQIKHEWVVKFFRKANCSVKGAKLLADLVCVPSGSKNNPVKTDIVLARGFATSSRLAVWCCLDFFVHLDWLVKDKLKFLKQKQLVVFVDDMGVCVGGMQYPQVLNRHAREIEKLASEYGLTVNCEKTKIYHHGYKRPTDYLGGRLAKNKLTLAGKARSHLYKINHQLKDATINGATRKRLKKSRSSIFQYARQLIKASD